MQIGAWAKAGTNKPNMANRRILTEPMKGGG
jgi:hypothetical protein